MLPEKWLEFPGFFSGKYSLSGTVGSPLPASYPFSTSTVRPQDTGSEFRALAWGAALSGEEEA